LKKETIVDARKILYEIIEIMKENDTLVARGVNADFERLAEVKENIAALSSRYYEFIPISKFLNQMPTPFASQAELKEQYDLLESLDSIEQTSKILLGALVRQQEMNPIDYVHHAINSIIEPLDKSTPEYELIKKYVDNTRTSQN